jgi:hypothetical protein
MNLFELMHNVNAFNLKAIKENNQAMLFILLP